MEVEGWIQFDSAIAKTHHVGSFSVPSSLYGGHDLLQVVGTPH